MDFGRQEFLYNTHNTVLVGFKSFLVGGYFSLQTPGHNTTDTAYGASARFGDQSFFELQGGYYERKFKTDKTLKGKGVIVNLVFGQKLTNFFSLSVIVSAKKIMSGDLHKRLTVKTLPFIGMSVGF